MQGASEQADPEDTSRPTNRKYKVVLLGEVNVGKTSLFQRIRLGRHQEWGTTVGVDQYTKEFIIDGAHVSVSTMSCNCWFDVFTTPTKVCSNHQCYLQLLSYVAICLHRVHNGYIKPYIHV